MFGDKELRTRNLGIRHSTRYFILLTAPVQTSYEERHSGGQTCKYYVWTRGPEGVEFLIMVVNELTSLVLRSEIDTKERKVIRALN